jgi:hypothetical protein
VHLVGFIMFQPIVEKLLNVENVFCEILFQSKLKNYKGIWVHSSIVGKSLVKRI